MLPLGWVSSTVDRLSSSLISLSVCISLRPSCLHLNSAVGIDRNGIPDRRVITKVVHTLWTSIKRRNFPKGFGNRTILSPTGGCYDSQTNLDEYIVATDLTAGAQEQFRLQLHPNAIVPAEAIAGAPIVPVVTETANPKHFLESITDIGDAVDPLFRYGKSLPWTTVTAGDKSGDSSHAGNSFPTTSPDTCHHLFRASSECERDALWTNWIGKTKSWIFSECHRWLGADEPIRNSATNDGSEFKVDKVTQHRVYEDEGDQDWQHATMDDLATESAANSRAIPSYVIEYAPLVHLYSGEEFWPCDMTDHLLHTTPNLNYTTIGSRLQHPTLENLDSLNKWQQGRFVFLKSDDDVEERPEWLGGAKNIPITNITEDESTEDSWAHYHGRSYEQGLTEAATEIKKWYVNAHHRPDQEPSGINHDPSSTSKDALSKSLDEQLQEELRHTMTKSAKINDKLRGGRSEAPAVLIVVDKGHGITDAFWFFFYSFNLGNKVFNIRFGNHVGDWEHSAVRFHHGKPRAVFFSEHNFGSAYSYAAVEKLGKRPVIYSATGTHAMYATSGTHPYVLPLGILHDQTDKGPLWDPTLNSYTYTYNVKKDRLQASHLTPDAPTGWFHFSGHWGDKFYPLQDPRQYRLAGQYHYVNGPLGPKFKNLGRRKICGGPDSERCVIKHWLGGSTRVPRWQHHGEEPDAWTAWTNHDRPIFD